MKEFIFYSKLLAHFHQKGWRGMSSMDGELRPNYWHKDNADGLTHYAFIGWIDGEVCVERIFAATKECETITDPTEEKVIAKATELCEWLSRPLTNWQRIELAIYEARVRSREFGTI